MVGDGALRRGEDLVVLLVHVDGPPTGEEGGQEGVLHQGEAVAVLVGGVKGEAVLPPAEEALGDVVLLDPQVAPHAQVNQGGSEGIVPELLVVDVGGHGRGDALGGVEEGDDGPGAEVLAPAAPYQDVVDEDQHHRQGREVLAPALGEGRPGLPLEVVLRRVDEALGEARHDGEALPDPEGDRGLEPGRVTGRPAHGVLGAGTLGAGVPGDLLHGDVLRQGDQGGGPVDGEIPAGAGDVPVEFVVVLEEADLLGGGVDDGVGVLPQGGVGSGVADADPHAVADPFGLPRDGPAVEQNRLHREADPDPAPAG